MDLTNRDRKLSNKKRKGRSVQGGGVKRIHLLQSLFAKRAAAAAVLTPESK